MLQYILVVALRTWHMQPPYVSLKLFVLTKICVFTQVSHAIFTYKAQLFSMSISCHLSSATNANCGSDSGHGIGTCLFQIPHTQQDNFQWNSLFSVTEALQHCSFLWGSGSVFKFPKFSFSLTTAVSLAFSRHVHARHLIKRKVSLSDDIQYFGFCFFHFMVLQQRGNKKPASITEYLNKLRELSFYYAKCCL